MKKNKLTVANTVNAIVISIIRKVWSVTPHGTVVISISGIVTHLS